MNLTTLSLKIIVIITLIVAIACSPTNNKTLESKESQKTFEGKIIYNLTFKDKTGEMTPEQAKMLMGNEQTYTIKNDKYKSEMNGMMKMTQFYLGQDTMYLKIGGMNNLLWIDTKSNTDELIDYTIETNAETIAGIECDLLTINSKEGTTKYYFNKKYTANPNHYKNHDYGFWKFCIEKTNSLPIKSISDDKDVYLEITMKEIKAMNIEATEFILPNMKRIESPEK